MKYIDNIAVANAAHWEEEVEKGGGHTIPWLDLDLEQLHRYMRGDLGEERLIGRREPRRFMNVEPEDLSLVGGVEGKNVLCLAFGGGQQSAVISLLGGHVTVVDFAQGQLAADREAAAHYGYEIRTIHGDMRDLSCLEAGSFDFVWGTATCYVPSTREVYTQVARVLKTGGLYRTDIPNPATVAIESDREGYRLSKPYSENVIVRDDGGYEFRHYFDDIFNGLSDNGLRLVQVDDRGRYNKPPPDAPPGSYSHESAWVCGSFDIVVKKEKS
jgi:SAM-dependent methyltransferase